MSAHSARLRLGVLISGRGSNMLSLADAAAHPDYPAEIVCVIANKAGAAGLEAAEARGLPAFCVPHRDYPDKRSFEEAITTILVERRVDLVCLAGFMRLLSPGFIERWRDRLINIHPSLLPAYKGLDTHARALADGVRIAGCSVHFVRSEVDTGPIVAQAAVPVLPDDTAQTLAARVLAAEHRLYPHAIAMIATGAARVIGEKVAIDPPRVDRSEAVLLSPEP